MNICGFVYPAGVMYCDTDRHENGDYKKIAFIHDSGLLDWYEKPEKIPGADLLRIEHAASTRAANYRAQWEKLPDFERYAAIYDYVGAFSGSVLRREYNALQALPRPADHIGRIISKYEFLILNRANIATDDTVKQTLLNFRKVAIL